MSDSTDYSVNGLTLDPSITETSGVILGADGTAVLTNVDVTPLHDMVYVRQTKDTMTPGGLHIPDSAEIDAKHGTVVYASKGARCKDGAISPLFIKEGDYIMYVGQNIPITINGETLYIVRESEAFCIVKPRSN